MGPDLPEYLTFYPAVMLVALVGGWGPGLLATLARSLGKHGSIRRERNLDAEQKKFANGMSTNFQVVKIQDDLAAAQAAIKHAPKK